MLNIFFFLFLFIVKNICILFFKIVFIYLKVFYVVIDNVLLINNIKLWVVVSEKVNVDLIFILLVFFYIYVKCYLKMLVFKKIMY